MTEQSDTSPRPRFGIGSMIQHVKFGRGRVLGYDRDTYVISFKGGEIAKVAFTFEGMSPEAPFGDPEIDRIREAVRDVIGEAGWIDSDLELGARWQGGVMRLIPGKEDVKPKDIPIEAFFAKIIGIREKLRVLEQKINNHKSLGDEEKLELEAYITRCYGSLTSFNVLFASKSGQFVGQKKES